VTGERFNGHLPGEWADQAACQGAPMSVMFPKGTYGGQRGGKPPDYSVGRYLCATCPVKGLCLDHALEHNERHGMWGGMDPKERDAEKRKRYRAAATARSIERTAARVREIVR